MKIIAGIYGSRKLVMPKTNKTRPMSDKVREALFNVLGDIAGLSVLDVYAGSGALAIEALSRGAALAVAIDSAREPILAMCLSKQALGIGGQLTIIESAIDRALPKLEKNAFDLIFADPPYGDIRVDILVKLSGLLNPNGTMVVSHSSRIAAPEIESMQRTTTRKYGDSSLSFYKHQ